VNWYKMSCLKIVFYVWRLTLFLKHTFQNSFLVMINISLTKIFKYCSLFLLDFLSFISCFDEPLFISGDFLGTIISTIISKQSSKITTSECWFVCFRCNLRFFALLSQFFRYFFLRNIRFILVSLVWFPLNFIKLSVLEIARIH